MTVSGASARHSRRAFPARAGLVLLLAGCGKGHRPCLPPSPDPSGTGGNVLVILMDDVGVDKLGVYDVHPRPAPTPNLDALAARGVRFVSAFNEPVCSPGRAALLTGRRPVHNGVGGNLHPRGSQPGLPLSEVTLPEALHDAPGGSYTSLAIGKWHLSALDDLEAPRDHGFDHFDGLLANAGLAAGDLDEGHGFSHWEGVVDGVVSTHEGYLTTDQADAAIEGFDTLPEPWFVYLAFNAAHAPHEVPPPDLWSEAIPNTVPGVGDAVIEAMDHEIGRVLAAVGDRATVVVTSDNGTSIELTRPPALPLRVKGTVHPGGTQVPLLVAGPGIAPAVNDSLVHAVDVFATVLDLAGIDPETLGVALDGTSVAPVLFGTEVDGGRECLFVEQYSPNGEPPPAFERAVLSRDHALVLPPEGPQELYRLRPRSLDQGPDLLGPGAERTRDDERALESLRERLDEDVW